MEYTEIKRADGIDMDPHYIAPEVPSFFVPLLCCWCKEKARETNDMCQETTSLLCFALSSPPCSRKPARAENAHKKALWLMCTVWATWSIALGAHPACALSMCCTAGLQGFQPDMTELHIGFAGGSYYRHKKVAQAHMPCASG